MLAKTAILIFSRAPEEEVQCKTIAENREKSLLVWKHLLNKTLAAANKTNLPVLLCTEEIQQGQSFGEKITHSISNAFNDGYENIIVIGSDTPNLSSAHLNFAKNELHHGKQIIVGKDRRGGIYLVALHRSAFKSDSFIRFSWQTNSLFKEIYGYAKDYSCSTLSEVLHDINNKKDVLTNLCSFYTKKTFRFLLLNISALTQILWQQKKTLIKYPVPIHNDILRGPPYRF